MKKFYLLTLLCLCIIPALPSLNRPTEKATIKPFCSNEIFLISQLGTTTIRAVNKYSIVGTKSQYLPNVVLDFFCNGAYSITISKGDNLVYSHLLKMPSGVNQYRMTIPVSFYIKGIYTMTVENIENGKTASGNFVVQ